MALTAHGLCFSFARGREPVLREIDFTPTPGRVTVLVGPNGSGKSTLLRLLLGSLRPTRGSVSLDGSATCRMPNGRRAHSLAYVAQRPDAAFAYAVRDAVSLGRLALGRPAAEDRAAADAAMELMELRELADEPLTTLSVGQQQRVAIARAIAQLDDRAPGSSGSAGRGPSRFLLADEPTAALDPRHAALAMRGLRTLATDRGIGVVLVLHDLRLAQEIADEAAVLRGGRIVDSGPPDRVLSPESLEAVFDVPFAAVAESIRLPSVL